MECKPYKFFQSIEERNQFIADLLQKHYDTLYLKARKLCRDQQVEPEELIQQLSAKMLEKADLVFEAYQVKENGVAYLQVMLKHLLIDEVRQEKKTANHKQRYAFSRQWRQLNPEELLIKRELEELPEKRLKANGFEEEDRAIFGEYFQGARQIEIAEDKDLNCNTVYTKVSRMRNFLKKDLKRTLT